ncbi:hypothetical protein ALP68_101756 [Pseudomonas ficuserectae]|uniref:Uncharacterized protein n=1 Tax=Pseudomonas amygdali pv. hibisci TaxID=251723 RepID=A0AB34U3P3_PSEA0|nr:hypothetical protein ALO69_101991 [Pseudomonas ficuserectae]KPX52174.1 hypothetical protein ALO67_101395 [Pseudomonas amygdali pv. hibisci]RMN56438.1 hypothetical protein ALQ57_101416 [Pseudomonas amygdali pv. hibisci]RMS28405.1 hypothetical protein ALP68_101756 [Pseudomonas ficuserectae]RMS37656.1 hypothetical protein ALP67_101638 [Pseudomonas ficuserectae]
MYAQARLGAGGLCVWGVTSFSGHVMRKNLHITVLCHEREVSRAGQFPPECSCEP